MSTSFIAPLLWTNNTVDEFQSLLKSAHDLRITWNWAPYHQLGFQVFLWARQNNLSLLQLGERLKDLSCPTPSRAMTSVFKNLNLLDETGRIKNLDPEPRMRETLRLIDEQFNETSKTYFLPTICDLQKLLTPLSFKFDLKLDTEFEESSKWFTHTQQLMKRFQDTSPWDTICVAEILIGTTKSASILTLHRL
ncbi:MAG: hypothetical protein SGI74_08250 [Oligoflexia bacterium]|nr:hypothetical protein [Oligoflexia bacterium]